MNYQYYWSLEPYKVSLEEVAIIHLHCHMPWVGYEWKFAVDVGLHKVITWTVVHTDLKQPYMAVISSCQKPIIANY